MGRYCSIGEGAIIRPPGKIYKGFVPSPPNPIPSEAKRDDLLTSKVRKVRGFTFYPVRIADFVTIGPGTIVEAAQIGHGVDIGKDSIIVCLSTSLTRVRD